jgi:sucrose phosphorylase
MPGVPQVYYVGLLAGENDMALLQQTGVGRDINRHHYAPGEVAAAVQRPVVQRLLQLVRLRNAHPAFGGSFSVVEAVDDSQLLMRWQHGPHTAELQADLAAGSGMLLVSDAGGAVLRWPLVALTSGSGTA